MSGSNQITASYTVPTVPAQTVQTQNSVLIQGSSGAISFGTANGITFGGNLNTITASVAAGATATGNFGALGAGTQTATSGTVSFANSNGISFGMSGSNQITASYTVPTQTVQSYNILAAGTQTANTSGSVNFANSNGISFGMSNNSQITASYTVPAVPAQTVQTMGLYAGGNTTGQSSSFTFDARSLSFSGAGIASVGYSAGSVIISVPAGGGGGGGIANAAGTQTATSGTVVFVNSNGLSFGMSNSSQITASYTVPTQSVQSMGLYATGATFGTSSTTVDARSLSISGIGNINVGYSVGELIISGVQSEISAGANITLTPSGSTVSIIGLGQAISGSNGSLSFQTVTFGALNGISFYTTNGSVVGSYTVPNVPAQTVQPAIVGLAGSGASTVTTGTVQFANANGFSFGLNGNTMTGSYTVPTQTVQTLGRYAVGNTTGQSSSSTYDARSVSYSGTGISIGHSAGNIIFSVTQSNQALSGSNGSFTFQTVTFGALNGLSFYTSNGSMVGSYTVPSVPAQTVQTMGLYAGGNTTGQSSLSTFDARSLSFSGAGIASVGYSAGSVIISVPSGGGAGDGVNILAAGTQTANTTGTVVFVNSNGVTFGMSNNSVITASVNAGGAAPVATRWIPDFPASTASQTFGSMNRTTASAFFFPFYADGDVQFNILYVMNQMSFVTSSVSGQQTISSRFGIYSNNASTLSLISSNSFSIAVTGSSGSATISFPTATATTGYAYGTTSGSASALLQSLVGTAAVGRYMGLQFGDTMSLAGGQYYWIGVHNRLSSSSAAIGISAAYIGNVVAPFAFGGPMGVVTSANTTNFDNNRPFPGMGVYTSTGSAGYGGTVLPASVFMSGIAHTLSNRPLVMFSST
jgi:hypothetical protein